MDTNSPPFVLVDWSLDTLAEEFQDINPKIPQMVQKDDIKYLAINLKLLDKYITPEEQAVVIEKWLPKLKESELDTLAILVPEKAIGQIVVRSIFLDINPEEFKVVFWDNWTAIEAAHENAPIQVAPEHQ